LRIWYSRPRIAASATAPAPIAQKLFGKKRLRLEPKVLNSDCAF
jgi:hypothetical protein